VQPRASETKIQLASEFGVRYGYGLMRFQTERFGVQLFRWRLPGALIGAALALVLASCSSDELYRLSDPTPSSYPIHGVDVSYYQGVIDWPQVRANGTTFAYIKATEGGDVADQRFGENWEGARQAGLERGAYHFYYFCRPVEEQIAWFEAHVPVDPDALPPALDMEWNPHSKTCRVHPPRDKILADMQRFLDELERHYGKRPVIYSSIDFHRDVLEGAFDDYPFWVRSVKTFPAKRYGERRWHFWQYVEKGSLPGISGYVDKNAFAGTHADWAKFVDGKLDPRAWP
jgi:lysozyme